MSSGAGYLCLTAVGGPLGSAITFRALQESNRSKRVFEGPLLDDVEGGSRMIGSYSRFADIFMDGSVPSPSTALPRVPADTERTPGSTE